MQYTAVIPKYIGHLYYYSTDGFSRNFFYSDSAIFYLTSKEGVPLEIDGLSSIKRHEILLNLSDYDTLTVEGVDSSRNRHWKIVKLHGLTYGYTNIATQQLPFFEKIVSSVRRVK